MTDHFNKTMLGLARRARGWSQAELAEALRVTQSKVSRVEGGQLSPAPEDLEAFARVLGHPVAFFLLPEVERGPASGCIEHHRARKSLTMGEANRLHATINIMRIHIGRILKGVELDVRSSFGRIDIDSVDGDAEGVAQIVRTSWRLPRGPIDHLTRAVEDAGAVIIPWKFETEKVDAVSQVAEGLPPLIFLNSGMPADRARMSLAHEVGHLVMHFEQLGEQRENEAQRFAAELLMPAEDIRGDLASAPLTIQRLAALKPRWRVSMKNLVYRAHTLGVITASQAKWLYVKMNKMGWARSEPVPIDPETPTTLREVLEMKMTGQGLSPRALADEALSTEQMFRQWYLGEPPLRLA